MRKRECLLISNKITTDTHPLGKNIDYTYNDKEELVSITDTVVGNVEPMNMKRL